MSSTKIDELFFENMNDLDYYIGIGDINNVINIIEKMESKYDKNFVEYSIKKYNILEAEDVPTWDFHSDLYIYTWGRGFKNLLHLLELNENNLPDIYTTILYNQSLKTNVKSLHKVYKGDEKEWDKFISKLDLN